MTVADRNAIDQVVEASRENGFGLRSMIHAVIDTEMFHRR